MKRPDIPKLNSILENHGVPLRITSLTKSQVELSNGLILTDEVEVRNFRRRLQTNDPEFLQRVEVIYGFDVQKAAAALSEWKRESARRGGLACQTKHGERIKQQLNTGTPWNKGKSGLQEPWNKGKTKSDDERIRKMGLSRRGELNPMYGKRMTDEKKLALSTRMKELIYSGAFTPNTNNKNTYWESTYMGVKYRSSWEALFQCLHPESEYETLRIRYCVDNQEKIYIVDFVDHKNKFVAEVKPGSLWEDGKNAAKIKALREWAASHHYDVILADQEYFARQDRVTDFSVFDCSTAVKIQKIYETCKKNRN